MRSWARQSLALHPFQVLILAGFGGVAVLLGYLVTQDPDLLRFNPWTTSPAGLALLALAVGLSILVLRFPALGLAVVLVFVYLNLSQILVRYHGMPSLLRLLAIPLFLAAWLDRREKGLVPALRHPLTFALGLYTLVLLWSTTWAKEQALADERLAEHLKALGIYLLVVFLAASRERLKAAGWILLGTGTLLGALGIFQVATGEVRQQFGALARIKHAHIYGDLFEPRIAGPLGDPNFFAQILLVLVPLALFAFWEGKELAKKGTALFMGGVLVTATVLTYSRGGGLALGCVLLLCLLRHRVQIRQMALGLGLVVLVVALLPAEFTRRLVTLEQILPGRETVLHPDSSFQKRRLLTTVAWKMFLDHPIAGVGAGNYTVHFDDYAEEVEAVYRQYEDPEERLYPHSLYLEIAAETGLLGLLSFSFVLGAAFATTRRARRSLEARADGALGAMAKGLEVGLVGYLVSSLFLHGHFLRYLWLLFGLVAAADLQGRTREAPAGSAGDGEGKI